MIRPRWTIGRFMVVIAVVALALSYAYSPDFIDTYVLTIYLSIGIGIFSLPKPPAPPRSDQAES